MTAAEALKKSDEVKNVTEVNGLPYEYEYDLQWVYCNCGANEAQKLKAMWYQEFLEILKYILFILFTRVVWKKNLPS